ncbi:MAG TPA: ATP synthase subunit I [Candidatus Saccharimonadia bacterium]|nr:ATP synthase subunit I [Candidatus Saccharimonadia bacterium]
MSNSVESGKRLVLRMVALQLGCVVLVALMWLPSGYANAQAFAAGGFIVAVGNALFGWRLFMPGVAPAAQLQRSVFAAEALKWLWIVLALWLALAKARLPGLPLVLGVTAAHVAFWIGLRVFR